MRILLLLFLFTCFRTGAQEVNIVLTNLKNEEKIDYLNFQGESYFDVSDTIRVVLKDEYAKLGLLVIKLKNGYVLSDFSNFYGLTNTGNEPIEFNFFKLTKSNYRSSVYTMKGADVFWDSRFLPEINSISRRK